MVHSEPKRKANNTNENSDEIVIIPPDGGFGWVIVAASFLIHIISKSITLFDPIIQSFPFTPS